MQTANFINSPALSRHFRSLPRLLQYIASFFWPASRAFAVLLSALLVPALVLATPSSKIAPDQEHWRERFPASVRRVIDGDTVELVRGSEVDTYRLLAIDAPETSENFRAGLQTNRLGIGFAMLSAMGKQAKRHLQDLLPIGAPVEIEFDRHPRDKYGRALVYLYRGEDHEMINELLLEDGTCWFYPPSPNDRYRERLFEASSRAERKGLGVWSLLGTSRGTQR